MTETPHQRIEKMIASIERQKENHNKDYWILEGFSEKQLDLVKDFVESFKY